jgi:hypothetical protein
MKILKYFILSATILLGLIFIFYQGSVRENLKKEEILSIAGNKDVLIIFNSGGWGDTPFDEAYDFKPVVEGIQQNLEEWGYSSVVIPYKRTKEGFLGRIAGLKDFLSSFRYSSDDLADTIKFINEKLPEKKIIVAGLSGGAGLVSETMKKIPDKTNESVLAIVVGPPFWTKNFNIDNLLQLNNDNKDLLTKGDVRLIFYAIRAPFKWLALEISGHSISLAEAFEVSGHKYPWSSQEVNSQITSFLEKKLQ